MKLYAALILILSILASCSAEPEEFIVKSPIDTEAAAPLSSFQAIEAAMGAYEQDFGLEIKSVNELLDLEYLRLDKDVSSDWMFFLFRRDPITHLYATSGIHNPHGPGFVMEYDIQTDNITDLGVTEDDSLEVLAAMKAFEHGLNLYFNKIGRFPLYMEDFFKGGYVKFKDSIEMDWSFYLTINTDKLATYSAIRKDKFPDLKFHYAITTDHHTDWIQEFEIHQIEPTNGMDAMYALCDIASAVKVYNTFEDFPRASVDFLIQEDYLKIDPEVLEDWNFSIVGTREIPFAVIEAISTDNFSFGADHAILLDMISGKFLGYGIPGSPDI